MSECVFSVWEEKQSENIIGFFPTTKFVVFCSKQQENDMLPYGNTAPCRYMDAVAQIPRMLFDSTANNRLPWRQKELEIERKYVHFGITGVRDREKRRKRV